jgi:hypothetical protein
VKLLRYFLDCGCVSVSTLRHPHGLKRQFRITLRPTLPSYIYTEWLLIPMTSLIHLIALHQVHNYISLNQLSVSASYYVMVDFYGGGNSTQIAFWDPVPTYRGTYNILSACLVTVGSCVWSALHLNIPKYGKASRQWWRKVKWLFVGLSAPELVAWTAFRQHLAARKLYISMREKLGQNIPTGFGRRLASLFRSGKRRRDAFNTKPRVANCENRMRRQSY